jgi:ATP-dependent Clp protease ATP-binding subunit ClpC
LVKRLKEQHISLELTEEAKAKISQEGYDPEYGARPLRRAIQKHIEDRLSEELLKGTVLTGQHVIIDVEKGDFIVKKAKKASLAK